MSTALARSLQPRVVPHADAIFNVSRSTLLIAALIQSPELLRTATEDRLHQSYRASAMPETDRMITLLRAAGHAAVVSGAGPSILVLASDPVAAARGGGAGGLERDPALDRPASSRGYQRCYARASAGLRARPLLTVGPDTSPGRI